MTCRECNNEIKGHERVTFDPEGGTEPHPTEGWEFPRLVHARHYWPERVREGE